VHRENDSDDAVDHIDQVDDNVESTKHKRSKKKSSKYDKHDKHDLDASKSNKTHHAQQSIAIDDQANSETDPMAVEPTTTTATATTTTPVTTKIKSTRLKASDPLSAILIPQAMEGSGFESDSGDSDDEQLGGTVTSSDSTAGADTNANKRNASMKALPGWLRGGVVVGSQAVGLKRLSTHISSAMFDILRNRMQLSSLFAVQAHVIPSIVVGDRDVCVCAPTGSGKTLAYAIPIVDALMRRVVPRTRALVLIPSRDLALQVDLQPNTSSTGGSTHATTAAITL
jgi:hypothetical protein